MIENPFSPHVRITELEDYITRLRDSLELCLDHCESSLGWMGDPDDDVPTWILDARKAMREVEQ